MTDFKIISLKWSLLLSMTGLYFFSFFQSFGVPSTIFNEIQSAFGISGSTVAGLSSAYLFVYAGMQLFGGMFVDRYGGIKVILLSGLFLCTGSLLFPLSQHIWLLYLSRILAGIGGSCLYLCIIKEVDFFFGSRNFAPITGVVCFIGYCGGLAGTKPFRIMVEHLGWRSSLIYIGIATFMVLSFIWFFKRKISGSSVRQKTFPLYENIKNVFKNPHSYPVFICFSINYSIYFVIQGTIGVKFLEDFSGMSALTATNYTFAMMLVTIVMFPLSGFFSKILDNCRKPFLVLSSALTCCASLLLLLGICFNFSAWVFLVSYIMLAISTGCTPVIITMMKEINPPDIAVFSIGIQNLLAFVAVAVLVNLTGIVLDFFKSPVVLLSKSIIYPPTAYAAVAVVFLFIAFISLIVSLLGNNYNHVKQDKEKSI